MKNWHAQLQYFSTVNKCWIFHDSYFGMMTLVSLCSLMMIVARVHSLFLNKQNLMHLFLISYCSGTSSKGEKKSRKSSKVSPSLPQTGGIGWICRGRIDVECVRYLVKNAVELEKVILDPRCPVLIGSPREYEPIEEIQAARERAKMLGRELSLGDKLVIL
jgi:hypothetical protein